MTRGHRRRSGPDADRISAGRRHLASIDPELMARVVGRPPQPDPDAERRAAEAVPLHRRPY